MLVEEDGLALGGDVAHVVAHDERRGRDRPDRHLRPLLVERDARRAGLGQPADEQHVHVVPVAAVRPVGPRPRLERRAVVAPVGDNVGEGAPAALDIGVVAPEVAPVIDVLLERLRRLVAPGVRGPAARVHDVAPARAQRLAHRRVPVLVICLRPTAVHLHVVDAPPRERLRVELLVLGGRRIAAARGGRLGRVRGERQVEAVVVVAESLHASRKPGRVRPQLLRRRVPRRVLLLPAVVHVNAAVAMRREAPRDHGVRLRLVQVRRNAVLRLLVAIDFASEYLPRHPTHRGRPCKLGVHAGQHQQRTSDEHAMAPRAVHGEQRRLRRPTRSNTAP